eukprot:3630093-Prymnesium_polylepis.1
MTHTSQQRGGRVVCRDGPRISDAEPSTVSSCALVCRVSSINTPLRLEWLALSSRLSLSRTGSESRVASWCRIPELHAIG